MKPDGNLEHCFSADLAFLQAQIPTHTVKVSSETFAPVLWTFSQDQIPTYTGTVWFLVLCLSSLELSHKARC
jgi:hypothetical protein